MALVNDGCRVASSRNWPSRKCLTASAGGFDPMTGVRLSQHSLRILNLFLRAPVAWKSGSDINRSLTIRSGTMYQILHRLEQVGWIVGDWEKVDPSKAGRSRKRLYRLTNLGEKMARQALAEFLK